MDNTSSAIDEKNKGKIVFKVRKGDFYDDLLKEDETEKETESCFEIKENDEHSSSNPINSYSKVNFSNLSPEEKDLRLKNLAKMVKHLRKKIRSYETKNEQNQRYSISSKSEKSLKASHKKLISNVIKAHFLLKSHMKNEKENNYIELFFELLANNKMKIDSSYFKKITEQIEKCVKETANLKKQNESQNHLNIYQDQSKPLIINFNNSNSISTEHNVVPSNIDLSQNYYEQLNKQHALLELYKQSLFFNYNYSMNSYNNNIM